MQHQKRDEFGCNWFNRYQPSVSDEERDTFPRGSVPDDAL